MKMKFKRYWILSSIVFIVMLINSKASLADPWERLGDIPGPPISAFCATLMNGEVYVTAGEGALFSFQVYDPSSDTWTRKADQPTHGVRYGACAVDGILYVIGGQVPLTAAVDAYDPGTDTWTRKADMINARRMPAVCVIDGRIYAAGGQGLDVYVEMYDPRTDTWTPLVGSTGPIQQNVVLTNWAVSGTVLLDEKSGDSKMYIMGGWSTQNRIWVYNPASNILELLDIEMSAPKGWAGDFVFNNKIYIMGGWTSGDGYQSDVWVFDPYAAPPAQQIRDVDAKGKQPSAWGTLKIAE